MTDAEFEELKYAAIAMGEKPVRLSDDGRALLMWGIDDPWNPREDDRDAFRLAARIRVDILYFMDEVEVRDNDTDPVHELFQDHDHEDVARATRLAITRAAAEMGKQMGDGDV